MAQRGGGDDFTIGVGAPKTLRQNTSRPPTAASPKEVSTVQRGAN